MASFSAVSPDLGCPGEQCWLSQSQETRCQTDAEGQLRCETLKRLWRHCPGKPPEELKTERSDAGPPQIPQSPFAPFDAHPPRRLPVESTDGVLGLFAAMEEQMAAMMHGFVGGMHRLPRLPRDAAPERDERASRPPRQPVRVDEI